MMGKLFGKEKDESSQQLPEDDISEFCSDDTTPDDNAAEKKPTKKALATEVFARMYGQPDIERKHIVTAFIDECELTKAGASTYYADIKKKYNSENPQ